MIRRCSCPCPMPGRVGQCERCGLPLRFEVQDRVRAAYRGCVGAGFTSEPPESTKRALETLRKAGHL